MIARFSTPRLVFAGSVAALAIGVTPQADAAAILQGDVTTNLSGSFFVDEAAVGGTDVTTTNANSPRNIGPRNWDLDSSGVIDAGDLVAGTVTVTGLGFASNGSSVNNTATSINIEFIYLGADGALGGGDDVSLGNETVTHAWSTAGEYYVTFDTPLSAAIDGSNNKFMTVLNTNGTGNLVTKAAALQFEDFQGPKLSVAGSFAPVPEPSSMALLALGGLACLRRRRGA